MAFSFLWFRLLFFFSLVNPAAPKLSAGEMQHVAGPFKKKFREYEQPWHIRKFDAVREEILELEPEILNDKPSNERVSCALLPQTLPICCCPGTRGQGRGEAHLL